MNISTKFTILVPVSNEPDWMCNSHIQSENWPPLEGEHFEIKLPSGQLSVRVEAVKLIENEEGLPHDYWRVNSNGEGAYLLRGKGAFDGAWMALLAGYCGKAIWHATLDESCAVRNSEGEAFTPSGYVQHRIETGLEEPGFFNTDYFESGQVEREAEIWEFLNALLPTATDTNTKKLTWSPFAELLAS